MITSIKLANFKIKQLETLVAQQAAVIEQMRETLEQFAQADLNSGNCASLEVATKRIRNITSKALALQPCPEVLNKVRADAIRDGLAAWENTVEPIYKFMNDYAQRIEQGEA